jgi:hypothetical protein
MSPGSIEIDKAVNRPQHLGHAAFRAKTFRILPVDGHPVLRSPTAASINPLGTPLDQGTVAAMTLAFPTQSLPNELTRSESVVAVNIATYRATR